jgi:hypothetical protein
MDEIFISYAKTFLLMLGRDPRPIEGLFLTKYLYISFGLPIWWLHTSGDVHGLTTALARSNIPGSQSRRLLYEFFRQGVP